MYERILDNRLKTHCLSSEWKKKILGSSIYRRRLTGNHMEHFGKEDGAFKK